MTEVDSQASEPVVRARHLQQWLANVRREEDPWRTRFFDALPADAKATIEGAARVAWLPAGLHVLLADVLLDAYGPARAHAYYRRALSISLGRPPFDSLVRTGARLIGLTPAAFLRWASHGYETSFRRCGSIRGEALGSNRGRVLYESLPAVCTASDAWLDSAQGSAYGIYDFLGISGVVRLDKSGRAEGRMQLELEWSM